MLVTVKRAQLSTSQPALVSQTRTTAACSPPPLNRGQLSGRPLWLAFKQQQNPLPFSPSFFHVLCPSIYLLPRPIGVSCLLLLPINHKTTRHVFNGSTGTVPASPLSPGRVFVVLFKPRRRDSEKRYKIVTVSF